MDFELDRKRPQTESEILPSFEGLMIGKMKQGFLTVHADSYANETAYDVSANALFSLGHPQEWLTGLLQGRLLLGCRPTCVWESSRMLSHNQPMQLQVQPRSEGFQGEFGNKFEHEPISLCSQGMSHDKVQIAVYPPSLSA